MYQPELTPQQIRQITVLTREHEEKLRDFLERQREAIDIEMRAAAARREMFFDAFCVVAAIITTAAMCIAVWAR